MTALFVFNCHVVSVNLVAGHFACLESWYLDPQVEPDILCAFLQIVMLVFGLFLFFGIVFVKSDLTFWFSYVRLQ